MIICKQILTSDSGIRIKCISDKKQIRFILTQNGYAIPVHLKFFRV